MLGFDSAEYGDLLVVAGRVHMGLIGGAFDGLSVDDAHSNVGAIAHTCKECGSFTDDGEAHGRDCDQPMHEWLADMNARYPDGWSDRSDRDGTEGVF